MAKTAQDIILKPVITEDSIDRLQDKKYTFYVAKNANKVEIAKAVEKLFDVKVVNVNTMNVKGKEKRMGRNSGFRPDRKKAIVTITGDKTIEFFDGMF
ncbi:MAG: 50S ribosomal protein L23 [Oscillospiraceae bacterium]